VGTDGKFHFFSNDFKMLKNKIQRKQKHASITPSCKLYKKKEQWPGDRDHDEKDPSRQIFQTRVFSNRVGMKKDLESKLRWHPGSARKVGDR